MQPAQQDIYPDEPRDDLLPFIPRNARRVLDVGCGRGGFGRTLRRTLGPQAAIMAIEAVGAQAAIARVDHGYDRVVDGFFPDDLPEEVGRFDLVCFNDVLEHVIDPWQMVSDTRRLLTPDGVIMASIPSIQFFPVVLQLLRGRWDYHDAGTLDRTHLRFFTRITMVEMFENADFRVIGCHGINDLAVSWLPGASRVRGTARKLAIRSMRDARYMRFVILATQAE